MPATPLRAQFTDKQLAVREQGRPGARRTLPNPAATAQALAICEVEAEGLTSEEQARLRQLEAENARLRMERDLLKRTVAFWVKETSTP
jgi:transposase-like protein